MKPEYLSVVRVSTAHLTQATASRLLSRLKEDPTEAVENGWVGYTSHGWIVYLYYERPEEEDFPEDLWAVIEWVRANCRPGVSHVWFDCDAPEVEGLPSYEW